MVVCDSDSDSESGGTRVVVVAVRRGDAESECNGVAAADCAAADATTAIGTDDESNSVGVAHAGLVGGKRRKEVKPERQVREKQREAQ